MRKLSSWLVKLLLGKSALAAVEVEGVSEVDPWEKDFKKWFLFFQGLVHWDTGTLVQDGCVKTDTVRVLGEKDGMAAVVVKKY